jgi:hypothetical protein
MEYRKSGFSKTSSLPNDYLDMVAEVFYGHFDVGLKIYNQFRSNTRFEVKGEVSSSEVILAVSLITENQLSATTAYASSDFDPKASAPTIEDLLSACVDAIGLVFESLLPSNNPERIEKVAEESLSAIDNIPFEWTAVETNQKQIFVKVDKSNLQLDALTHEWLKKHAPELQQQESDEQKQTENLFIIGPRSQEKKPSESS